MILSPPADISVRPPLLLHALKYKCSRSHHHHRHHHHHHHRHHHQHHRNHCHHHTNQQIYICTYIYTHIRCVLVGCSLFVCFNWIFSVFEQDPCYLCVSTESVVCLSKNLVICVFQAIWMWTEQDPWCLCVSSIMEVLDWALSNSYLGRVHFIVSLTKGRNFSGEQMFTLHLRHIMEGWSVT